MNTTLYDKTITCPYCWESFSIGIEPSIEVGECYIEDCYVCCRPIEICLVSKDSDSADVRINRVEGNEF